MQLTTLHVFVSSTWLDLQSERQAVEAALQRLRETKFIGMEYFGSRDETTRQASLEEVDRCQVYVGLFGGRYGSGITEAEQTSPRFPRHIWGLSMNGTENWDTLPATRDWRYLWSV